MAVYSHPGVYVEEVPGGAKSIQAASTSTPIFVGETERGPLEPTKIRGRADFERVFGGYWRENSGGTLDPKRVDLAYALDLYFANGGREAYILRLADSASTTTGDLEVDFTDGGGASSKLTFEASSPGAWAGDLKVAFASDGASPPFDMRISYKASWMEEADEEVWTKLTLDPTKPNFLPDMLERSQYLRLDKDQVSQAEWQMFPDTAQAFVGSELEGLTGDALSSATGGNADFPDADLSKALSRLDGVTDAALLVAPDLDRTDNSGSKTRIDAFTSYVEQRRFQDLFFIMDLPKQSAGDAGTAATSVKTFYENELSHSDMAGSYWPWVEVADPVGVGKNPRRTVPPSGAIAGIMARTDARRGVWKAPAGVEATVGGIAGLDYEIDDLIQGDLNPEGINALRMMPGAGTVVWGSRTMEPASEWRYVPVRRTAMFLRKSIYNGIQWAVFEPNDEDLWASLKLTIEAFMDQQFRRGAFAGDTSDKAYFVKCDAETTPPADQAAGIVNVWVGFAPLRPAEFVVVKLRQMTGESP